MGSSKAGRELCRSGRTQSRLRRVRTIATLSPAPSEQRGDLWYARQREMESIISGVHRGAVIDGGLGAGAVPPIGTPPWKMNWPPHPSGM